MMGHWWPGVNMSNKSTAIISTPASVEEEPTTGERVSTFGALSGRRRGRRRRIKSFNKIVAAFICLAPVLIHQTLCFSISGASSSQYKKHLRSLTSSRPKFKIIEVAQELAPDGSQLGQHLVPQQQRLALQIHITVGPTPGRKDAGTGQQVGSNSTANHTRPAHNEHDQQTPRTPNRAVQLRQPYDMSEVHNVLINDSSSSSLDGLQGLFHSHSTPQQAAVALDSMARLDKPDEKQAPTSHSKSVKLIRTQHRPPWSWQQQRQQQQYQNHSKSTTLRNNHVLPQIQMSEQHRASMGKRFLIRLTTSAPVLTTTEFYRLISSAHSPLKIDVNKLKVLQGKSKTVLLLEKADPPKFIQHPPHWKANQTGESNLHDPEEVGADEPTSDVPSIKQAGKEKLDSSLFSRSDTFQKSPFFYHSDNSNSNSSSGSSSSSSSGASNNLVNDLQFKASSSQNRPAKTDSRIVSSEISIKDDDEMFINKDGPLDEWSADEQLTGRRHVINYTINASAHNQAGRPVTIIRHSPSARRHHKRPPTTRSPGQLGAPDKLLVLLKSTPRAQVLQHLGPDHHEQPQPQPEEEAHRDEVAAATTPGPPIMPQLVRLIAKQKHKYDDNITSPPLTVIDTDTFRLPPNTTAVHNNRLLVRIKPGKYQPARFQATTEFPYYNAVAGITPPYPTSGQQTSTPRPMRPSSVAGQSFGLLPAPTSTQQQPQQNYSTFGAQNIRFPAAQATSSISDYADPPPAPQLPAKFNVSVPDDAHIVGPNRVPDKLVLDGGEQLSTGSATVTSDTTIVGRPPDGASTINQDGIIRLSTTRRPSRFTTKRVNIVSANTTVITANPDELHEVLINSVANSHHLTNRPASGSEPGPRPSILASIAKLFNASVTTTAIALMTLVKTILIAVLVMFLPPIALTAAIVQAVSMG